MSDSLKEFLEGITDWEDQSASYPKIPEGTYQAQLIEAVLCQSKKGNWQVKRQHLISSGEQQGQVLFDYMQLQTPRGPHFLAQWIRKMGFEVPPNPIDIEDVVTAISDMSPTVQLEIKHDGDFVNGRVLELLDTTEVKAKTSNSDAARLARFAKSHQLDGHSSDPLAAIKRYTWDSVDMSADEVSLLQRNGADVTV